MIFPPPPPRPPAKCLQHHHVTPEGLSGNIALLVRGIGSLLPSDLSPLLRLPPVKASRSGVSKALCGGRVFKNLANLCRAPVGLLSFQTAINPISANRLRE